MYLKKKKLKGYVLIEIMMAFSLGTMLLLMIYKAYNSITASVNFLKNTNDLNIEKTIFNFNARRDFCELYIPLEIDLIYDYAEKITKKGDKKEENPKEKDGEKYKKKFEELIKYFPILYKKEAEFGIIFYSTRTILKDYDGKRLTEITYKFIPNKLINNETLNKENKKNIIYSLIRSEKNLKNNEIKEYEIINFVEDPLIKVIYPFIKNKNENKDEKKENQNKNNLNGDENNSDDKKEDKKEKKLMFEEWSENPVFEIKEIQDKITPEDFLKKNYCPCQIIFEGAIISENKTRKVPFSFVFSIANIESCLQKLFLKIEKYEEKNKKNEKAEKNTENKENADSQKENNVKDDTKNTIED